MNNRQACSDCSLRGQPVSEYTGSAHPDILFVGEYPTRQRIESSVPVAGGELITHIINDEMTTYIKYGHVCAVRCVPDKAECNGKNIDICAQQLKVGNTAARAPWLPVQWKFDVGCGSNYGATKHLVC